MAGILEPGSAIVPELLAQKRPTPGHLREIRLAEARALGEQKVTESLSVRGLLLTSASYPAGLLQEVWA
jgi:hypothetical protein